MNSKIKKILSEIEKNGFEAYVIGGYVRDYILGITSNDIDICTNAKPKDLIEIFKNYQNKKIKDYSIVIKFAEFDFEITTYRIELNYVNRKPTEVVYTNNLIEDLSRRDFTINTLCMNQSGDVIDLLNAKPDIENKIIKSIGDIKTKITEDPLRILRAIRFTSTHNFKLDDNLKNIIRNNNYLVSKISPNKIKEEMNKIITSDRVLETFQLIKELDLYNIIDIKFDKITKCNDLLGMYSQMRINNSYTFTKKELQIISDIKAVLQYGKIDNTTLFYYDLYINTLAAQILNICIKKVNEIYKSLPIKKTSELAISVEEICKIKNIKPSKQIKEIQEMIIKKILNNELINDNNQIKIFLERN